MFFYGGSFSYVVGNNFQLSIGDSTNCFILIIFNNVDACNFIQISDAKNYSSTENFQLEIIKNEEYLYESALI